ncbi:unnamed protein product [Haemonchus placei]|uniref:HNOB domain-containing protein n=1 Tax=Haemonchus placei TaxID=6290 RepID=A0A0N4VUS3_HAEPC|nr:unnamed protein product [Haemonchus placei]
MVEDVGPNLVKFSHATALFQLIVIKLFGGVKIFRSHIEWFLQFYLQTEKAPTAIPELIRTQFGFIHESVRQLMLRKFGTELWQNVLTRAGFESGKENIINHYYPDSDTYLLVDSVAILTKMSREQVWELYGSFLIEYTMEIGWDELIRNMSPNLKVN